MRITKIYKGLLERFISHSMSTEKIFIKIGWLNKFVSIHIINMTHDFLIFSKTSLSNSFYFKFKDVPFFLSD